MAIRTVDDLSSEFLTQALKAPVTSFTAERIGTGQVGECHRIHVEYAPDQGEPGPSTVVLKLAASGTQSRGTGWRLGIYERESRFYSEIAPVLNSPFLAPCYSTATSEKDDTFHVLLEDMRSATVGNEIAGATLEQARLAVQALGELQGAALRGTMPDWLDNGLSATQSYLQGLWDGFLVRYEGRVKPEHVAVVDKFVACFDRYIARVRRPEALRTLVHGDYRLDNMLFRQEEGQPLGLTVVDWQTLGLGPVCQDLAYLISVTIPQELRKEHARDLIQIYYDALGPNPPFTVEECIEHVREQAFLGLPMAFASPMILERTDRGDEMFLTMLERMASYILDVNALELLPEPGPAPPLAVKAEDEGAHPHTPDPLHNESWYFDVADPEQGIGLWIRLGVTPNQKGSWYNALICGPGRPTIAVVDFEAPTPGEDLVINSERIKATHGPEKDLERYRVTLIGRGESFDDPAALLRGEKGEEVSVLIDLVWETSGTPYQWRMATRYEIPCTVSGRIVVDDSVTRFTKAPGQRDHSWGVRDWWSFDWVWTAFHLEDGTHLHGVQVRLPSGNIAVGYSQAPTVAIMELTGVEVMEQVSKDGLIKVALINYKTVDSEVMLHVKPMGQAPVRLESPDNRLTFFPRLWAEVETQDGRRGVGWVEWNFCQGQMK